MPEREPQFQKDRQPCSGCGYMIREDAMELGNLLLERHLDPSEETVMSGHSQRIFEEHPLAMREET